MNRYHLCCGAVAQLEERPSNGPGSWCNSIDLSSNPGCGKKAAPSVEHGNKCAVWELERKKMLHFSVNLAN